MSRGPGRGRPTGRVESEGTVDPSAEGDGNTATPAQPSVTGLEGYPPEDLAMIPGATTEQPQPVADRPQNGRVTLNDVVAHSLSDDDREGLLESNKYLRQLERETKTTFTPEEKQLILNRNLHNLSAVDNKTNELLEQYSDLYEMDRGSKLKRWLINFRDGKVLKSISSIGGGAGLRILLHKAAIHGFGVSGMITGSIVGAVMGGWSARQAETHKQYSSGSIIAEYNELKSQSGEGSATKALSFLQSVLDQRHLPDEKVEKGKFIGKAGELFKLLLFYKGEMESSLTEDEGERQRILDLLSDEGSVYRDDFVVSAKEAIFESTKSGALKGALVGLGFGAVSDVVGGLIHHWRVEHFKAEYLEEHAGYNNTFHGSYSNLNASAPDIRPDIHFDALNNGHGLDLQATPYGNTLSSTIHDGLQNGQLHVPDAYLTQMTHEINPVTGQLFTSQEATGQFVYNFNFAQVPNVGDHWNHGGVILMNKDGVQELMNRAVQFNSGHWNIDPTTNVQTYIPEIDYQKFAEALKNSGTFLTNQFPADYGALYSTPNMLMSRAIEEAQRQAAENIAQSAVMGAGIGLMTDRATTAQANKISGGGDKDSGRGAQNSGGAEGATEEQQRQTRGTTPAPTTAVVEPAPAVGAVTEVAPVTEPEVETAGPVVWRELFESNRDTFEQRANNYLLLPSKGWAKMKDEEKNNFVGLFTFIEEYNQGGLRFKIRFKQGTTDVFKLTEAPTIASPRARIENDREGRTVNFDSGASIRITFQTRDPEDKAAGEQWPMRDVVDPTTGKLNYDFFNMTFREARAFGGEAAIMIQRKWDVKGKALPLFRGDDVNKKAPEIIGFDAEARKLRTISNDGKLGTIDEADFKNIYGFNIYHWAKGGTDGQYNRRG